MPTPLALHPRVIESLAIIFKHKFIAGYAENRSGVSLFLTVLLPRKPSLR